MDFSTQKAWTAMQPRLRWRSWENPTSRCSNIAAHATRENHYAILAHLKISQVFIYKISITLLISYMFGTWVAPIHIAKVAIIIRKTPAEECFLHLWYKIYTCAMPMEHRYGVSGVSLGPKAAHREAYVCGTRQWRSCSVEVWWHIREYRL